ncbi:MAG TPA: hypothetical protein VFI18_03995 [Gaiellales bacterium]|nr:hypothetical protein [Gaiellales bacterium]
MGPRWQRYAAGLRRLLLLIAGLDALTAVVSLVLGLLLGAGIRRSLAMGFYLVGSLLLVVGVLYGIRPPVRTTGGQGSGGLLGSLAAGGGSARWASAEDLKDSLSSSALFITLGMACLAVGVAVDPRDGLL